MKYEVNVRHDNILKKIVFSNTELGLFESVDNNAGEKYTKMRELKELANENKMELKFIEK